MKLKRKNDANETFIMVLSLMVVSLKKIKWNIRISRIYRMPNIFIRNFM